MLTIVSHLISPISTRPLAVKQLLNNYGDHVINGIDVCRQPIWSVRKRGLDVLTRGAVTKLVRERGYDDVFHLFCIVTLDDGTRIRLEKNHRLTITVNPGP